MLYSNNLRLRGDLKSDLAKNFTELVKCKVEEVIDNFKQADKTQTHAEAEQSRRCGNERQCCDLLLSADPGVERIPDEHLENEGIVLCVVEQKLSEILKNIFYLCSFFPVTPIRNEVHFRPFTFQVESELNKKLGGFRFSDINFNRCSLCSLMRNWKRICASFPVVDVIKLFWRNLDFPKLRNLIKFVMMIKPAQRCENQAIFKQNYNSRTVHCSRNGLYCYFSLGGNVNFEDFLQKSFYINYCSQNAVQLANHRCLRMKMFTFTLLQRLPIQFQCSRSKFYLLK